MYPTRLEVTEPIVYPHSAIPPFSVTDMFARLMNGCTNGHADPEIYHKRCLVAVL